LTSKILLPHDGTEISDKALDKAKEFAKAFNAELYILHVIEHIPIPPSLILANDRQWIAQSRRSIAKKLKEGWLKMAKGKKTTNTEEIIMAEENGTSEFALDAENIQMPLAPKMETANSEAFVKPGKRGVTNAQMIPAMREALNANDNTRLAGLRQYFPQVYISSVKYLSKEHKAKLEGLAI
jgi:nucleotide-binding universal stress UspA family protein